MQCDKYQELLSAYLDGELDPQETARVREHLAVCPHCREELASLEAVTKQLHACPHPVLPGDFHSSMMKRLERELPVKQPLGNRWMTLAAGVLLVTAVGLGSLSLGLGRPAVSTLTATDAISPKIEGSAAETENPAATNGTKSKASAATPPEEDRASGASGGTDAASHDTLPQDAKTARNVPMQGADTAQDSQNAEESRPSENTTAPQEEPQASAPLQTYATGEAQEGEAPENDTAPQEPENPMSVTAQASESEATTNNESAENTTPEEAAADAQPPDTTMRAAIVGQTPENGSTSVEEPENGSMTTAPSAENTTTETVPEGGMTATAPRPENTTTETVPEGGIMATAPRPENTTAKTVPEDEILAAAPEPENTTAETASEDGTTDQQQGLAPDKTANITAGNMPEDDMADQEDKSIFRAAPSATGPTADATGQEPSDNDGASAEKNTESVQSPSKVGSVDASDEKDTAATNTTVPESSETSENESKPVTATSGEGSGNETAVLAEVSAARLQLSPSAFALIAALGCALAGVTLLGLRRRKK